MHVRISTEEYKMGLSVHALYPELSEHVHLTDEAARELLDNQGYYDPEKFRQLGCRECRSQLHETSCRIEHEIIDEGWDWWVKWINRFMLAGIMVLLIWLMWSFLKQA